MRFRSVLRRTWLAGVLALLAFAPWISLPGTARADGPAGVYDDFTIDQFYLELAPYGEWVHHPVQGYVWLPRAVGPDWRPFTVGNWIYTEEYGWYWDSYEPFAWAVYHYGRWGFDPPTTGTGCPAILGARPGSGGATATNMSVGRQNHRSLMVATMTGVMAVALMARRFTIHRCHRSGLGSLSGRAT